jgi:putative Mg2+ transporter-C (MgtC) family protein
MLDWQHLLTRLVLAAILGSVVGLERERKEWAAGLREHMLVCLGSALFMIVSAYGFVEVLKPGSVILDPSRVAAQVVTGIGFLGAGTILVRGETIRGLTTAASLWAIAAVGLAIGGGMYVAGIFTTALLLIILAVVKPLERLLYPERKPFEIYLRIRSDALSLPRIEAAIHAVQGALIQTMIRPAPEHGYHTIDLTVRKSKQSPIEVVLNALQAIDGVTILGHRRL